jgi:Ca-activated chloride channel homolog
LIESVFVAFTQRPELHLRTPSAMRQPWIAGILFILTLLAGARRTVSQTNAAAAAQSTASYSLNVSVDEVSLTFHAADSHGLPINDLKLDELSIYDNEKPARRIVAFQVLQDSPIRAGILIDTSESMNGRLSSDRVISIEYAQRLLRQQTDQAFVMEFGYISKVVQTWTRDPVALTAGIRAVTAGGANPLGGTAIFDTIYRACFYWFGKINQANSGNFILLFSDGEDNASHVSLEQAVDMCQRTNTAIYAFRAEPNFSFSTGPKTLADLASETGGRVFHADGSEAEIYNDLRMIEADRRNEYRLVYKPPDLKPDGSFHRIALIAPERVETITIRSGYYAPAAR